VGLLPRPQRLQRRHEGAHRSADRALRSRVSATSSWRRSPRPPAAPKPTTRATSAATSAPVRPRCARPSSGPPCNGIPTAPGSRACTSARPPPHPVAASTACAVTGPPAPRCTISAGAATTGKATRKAPGRERPGARVRLVPVPCHLQAPLGWPPFRGPPDRVARGALDGCDRGGADHRVVAPRLRHQHPHPGTLRPRRLLQPRRRAPATTRSSSARSPTSPTWRRSSPRWGSTRARREERRAAPGLRGRRRQRQRGRAGLQRGPDHRDPGPDGQPEGGRRVRVGLGDGTPLRASPRRDGDDRLGPTPRGTTPQFQGAAERSRSR
jgi:hypothetical protein